jgi:membrane-associated PAP2 superfamily phosphatase
MYHGALPLGAFVLFFLLVRATAFDLEFARVWAWNAETGRWLAERSWWAAGLLHRGGRDAVVGVLAALSFVALAGSLNERWRALRGTALFIAATMVSSWALVGALKHVTGVDCPWDLADFGGTHPYAAVFAARIPGAARGACFPGAHSASGFALFAFYFALRERRPDHARLAFFIAALVGTLFAIAQEARGAHFLSHDVTSAIIAWLTCLAGYCARRRWIAHAGSAAALPA